MAPTTPDYFFPFASGDRPQPAPLLASSSSAVLLYLGAGLDLYPVAARYAGYSTFLYVDAKPRLTRAPGDRDHAAWRAPEDVARSVLDRALGVLTRWELVAPEILKFEGRGIKMFYIFATLDFELVDRASAFPFVGTLLERVEGLYVHGLYISPETNLRLPSLRTVYAIPGNASCVDVDFIQEHDCTPPDPSSPYYIPTRTEQQHYERLCAWAGVNPHAPPSLSPEPYGSDADQLLEKFVGLALTAPKSKKKGKRKEKRGPPLRFVLIDQISWDDNLSRGTIPPPPVPSRTGFAHELLKPPDEIKPRSVPSLEITSKEIPHVLPPLPRSLRGHPSTSSLRRQTLRAFPSTQSLRGLAQLHSAPPRESTDTRISRPKSGGGTSQGLVRCSSRRTGCTSQGGGYRVSKTVREAEAVWEERDRKERERKREEKKMRERGTDGPPPKKGFFKFLAHGIFGNESGEGRHAHTV
ncbi:unnamed protein product [Rhizoctonia solani]|uniref:Uncharacterized protein n=1 Tax=Rhizoctonia solani TaxID=456999 RepID=A0A8H3HXI4_9AGAM|nr:unnamed protein product [Rhizoctonia solani]